MTAFAFSLYELALEDGNTAQLEVIRNLCFEKIAGGEARSLVSSSINGKSFNFNISKSADVLFTEVSEAIRMFRNKSKTTSEMDFSGI